MTTDRELSAAWTGAASALRNLFRQMAYQDWLVLIYLCMMMAALGAAPEGSDRTQSARDIGGLLGILVFTIVLVRGRLLRHPYVAPLVYRFGVYGTVQYSYVYLHGLLPQVNTHSLDAELHSLDLALFGVEPAIWLDRVVTPFTSEWFAFFYFGYFFLLAVHVLPMLLASRGGRLLSEFAVAILTLFCVAHIIYMLVPGYGPYHAVPDEFENALPQGLWVNLVMKAVGAAGAAKDIFPSLHTAAPTLLALFSYRHRDKMPWRYTWPITCFFALNIIIATMFLRWHWVIDVVAGFALANICVAFAANNVDRWYSRREEVGLQPMWPIYGQRL